MTERVSLARFRSRVRLTRAWRGFAVGGTVAGVLGILWSILDLFRVLYTSWPLLLVLVGSGAVIGTLIGCLLGCENATLAKSIDRRAGLKDRLAASLGLEQESSFFEELNRDATTHLSSLRPSAVYPLRLSRWHAGLLAAIAVTSGIFLLGNSGLMLSESQRKERADMQKIGAAVERVIKPLLDKPNKDPEEKELAEKLQRYQAELKRGRMGKQEAMQSANDIAKQADELVKHRLDQAQQEVATAKDALEKMTQAALEKEGLSEAESQKFKTPEEAQAAEQGLQQQMQDIRQMLDRGKDASGQALTERQRAELNEKLKELERQLELTQKAKDFMDRLTKNPEWKTLQEMLAKLGGSPGNSRTLTEDELKEMIKKLEELADKFKTDADMKRLILAMENALKNRGQGAQLSGIAQMCLGLQMPGQYGHPGPGNGQELYFANLHKIPLSDKPSDIKAKAIPLGVTGDRQQGGTETYIETKGPSGLGAKSKVPYFDVLPKYRHEAEQALNREQIPPEEQKRVKDYFDSLQEGSK